MKTMGMRLTKLRPVGGFCAETAGAVMLIGTAVGGIPVSDDAHHHQVRSWESVPRNASRPFGGAWLGVLCGPGSSPSLCPLCLAAATWLVLPHG